MDFNKNLPISYCNLLAYPGKLSIRSWFILVGGKKKKKLKIWYHYPGVLEELRQGLAEILL